MSQAGLTTYSPLTHHSPLSTQYSPLSTQYSPLSTQYSALSTHVRQPGRPHHRKLQAGRPHHRRGVILLVALGMLMVFALAVVMFVISARQHKLTARAYQRVERYDDNFEEKLDSALMILLRGTHNAACPIAPHGLLEDMYGSDSVPASASDAPLTVSASAAITATLSGGSTVTSGLLLISVQDARLASANGYFNGRVLTVVDGAARMQSTRIVGYNWDSASGVGTFQVLVFPNGAVPRQNDHVLVNGREFNGSGFGYDATTGRTTRKDSQTGLPAALLPNFAAAGADGPAYASGGADEGYDAADFNNMHLAARLWNAASGRWEVLLPSFHRPDLINYMHAQGVTNQAAALRKFILRPLQSLNTAAGRRAFNADNPILSDAYDDLGADKNGNGIPDHREAFGALMWDVDNDGDGLVDSVWLDLGMPVQTAPDGRQFKPLFAFLVLDMDGRLNLNAHSSVVHIASAGADAVGSQPFADRASPPAPRPVASLPRGQGNSPVAVNLRAVLTPEELEDLLAGVAGTATETPAEGRYGEYGQLNPLAGGTDNQRDPEDVINHPEYPGGYGWPAQTLVATSATGVDQPVDFSEKSTLGLDKHGQPLRMLMGPLQEPDHPLQFNPYQRRYVASGPGKTAVDSPLSMGDMEALLRRYDIDAQSLGTRLKRLVPDLWNETDPDPAIQQALRKRQGLVTAESYDTPVFTALVTREMLQVMQTLGMRPTGNHILDLLAAKIVSEESRAKGAIPANAQTLIANSLPLLLPPEVVRGERMDVNRPWGNSRDDNNNGIVDEPGEMNGSGVEYVWWDTVAQITGTDAAKYAPFAGVPLDHNNDGKLDANDLLARQLYARHLYVLMMMLVDRGYVMPVDPAENMSAADKKRHTARRIAQWAVNVVDFRDPDSMMTPFEFDYEPFVDNNSSGKTWNVDGQIEAAAGAGDDGQAWRGLVWGCERPQLLLTETLAFHDTRREDLNNDDGAKEFTKYKTKKPKADPNFDQKRRPQGSLFVELYNPWHEPVPYELRPADAKHSRLGGNYVDLGRTVANKYPVWQLAITGAADAANDLSKHPDTAPLHLDPVKAERLVWFTAPDLPHALNPDLALDSRVYYSKLSAAAADPENKVAFSTSSASADTMFLVAPGQYTVVGPRVQTRIGRSGDRNSATGDTKDAITIRLLDPAAAQPQSADPSVAFWNKTSFSGLLPAVRNPTVGQQVKRPGGIVINMNNGNPRPLSVSEPGPGAAYYKATNSTTQDPDDTTIKYPDAYTPPLDSPLDDTNTSLPSKKQGTVKNFRTVYLQRLANPLAPYHVTQNPYITVDRMPIDVTVFNGEAPDTDDDPDDPLPRTTTKFASRERTGDLAAANVATSTDYNIWRQAFSDPDDRKPRDFAHSLGCVSGFANGGNRGEVYFASTGVWTSAEFGAGSPYIGDPRGATFPWLTWNNTPFVSHLELMNVPASSPSRLLHEYHLRTNAAQGPFYDHYRDRTSSANNAGPGAGPPYGHLLNFFHSSSVTGDEAGGWNVANDPLPAAGTSYAASNFHRVFEFLRVPSRFDGAHQFLNPQVFMGNQLAVGHSFHPPFNRLSAYRDAGLININTIFDDGTTWRAIMNNDGADASGTYLRNDLHWRKVFLSRQGYGPLVAANQPLWPTLDPNVPTLFANPFQPYSSGYDVPVETLRRRPNAAGQADPNGTPREFVEATLLRPDPLDPTRPLMAPETVIDDAVLSGQGESATVGAGDARAAYRDGDRNPYFRYETLKKLGNTVTTRSNVYAVWITVGYFEVTPNASLARDVYPDGYVLGAELGSDSGEIVRHRLFGVIDRSIPVAFQRGEDHNVRNAISLKRIIE
jgi:hypothetical protein